MCIQDTRCAVGLSFERIIMECRHDEYGDLPLTIGAESSRASELLRNRGRRHPDANAFRHRQCHFYDTSECRSHMDCTNANQ